MRIALDEMYEFLFGNDMDIYLVVFDTNATLLGEKFHPDLQEYIDHNYVLEKRDEEYNDRFFDSIRSDEYKFAQYIEKNDKLEKRLSSLSESGRQLDGHVTGGKLIPAAALSVPDEEDSAYHPQKLTCLQLCIGAKLNLDETNDLLSRAGD